MTRILYILPILFLTGCCSLSQIRSPADLPDDEGAYIEFLRQDNEPEKITVAGDEYERAWQVLVRYFETTPYSCAIQIIEFENSPRVIIEAFETPDGMQQTCYDHHWSETYGKRTMTIYPGDVVGAVWSNGFAMLAEDETGRKANVAPGFNVEHQASHGIHGRVVNADRSLGFEWSIDAREDGVTVTIPPERLVPRPDDEETIFPYERTDR